LNNKKHLQKIKIKRNNMKHKSAQSSEKSYKKITALQFYQEDQKTWVFHLPKRKWSDGTPVTPAEILAWIESLRTGSNRHIKYLKLADKVTFLEAERILKIRFPIEMDATILHELSLADSGLFPTNYKTVGWSKTVGPYFVASCNYAERALLLSANKLSPLFNCTGRFRAGPFQPVSRSHGLVIKADV
jgi:hypothetical protein